MLVSTLVSVVSATAGSAGPFAHEPPDQLRGQVLRVGRAAAVAEYQQLPSRLQRLGNRPGGAAAPARDAAHALVQRDGRRERRVRQARRVDHRHPATATPAARVRGRPARWSRIPRGVSCSGSYIFGVIVDLNRIVLPRRMAFPVVGHQDAAQIGMAVEVDAEQVADLALGPAHRWPDARQRRQRGIGAGHANLHAQPLRRRRRSAATPSDTRCTMTSKRGSRGR